jgi:hypothetical protein
VRDCNTGLVIVSEKYFVVVVVAAGMGGAVLLGVMKW